MKTIALAATLALIAGPGMASPPSATLPGSNAYHDADAIACCSAMNASPPSATHPGSNAYRLSENPIAIAVPEQGFCKIRGAVWGKVGPRAHARVGLVDIATGETYRAETNFHGIYSIEVEFDGSTRYFKRVSAIDGHPMTFGDLIVCMDVKDDQAFVEFLTES